MFINTISESKSKIFKECNLKYKYRYVDKLPEVDSTNADALHFGSYIHKIFEDGYQAKSVDELLVIAESQRKNYEFSKSYEPKIKVCIENFFRFNAKLSETVATEMIYEVVYDEEKSISFNGVIDRVIKGKDGGFLIIDYKTSKKELSKIDLYQDPQMQGYAYAIHKKFNVPLSQIIVAHYYPITDNFVVCSSSYSAGQIKKYIKDKVDQVWKIRKLKKDEFLPSRNSFCNWCAYKSICPEFNTTQICEERISKLKQSKNSEDKTTGHKKKS